MPEREPAQPEEEPGPDALALSLRRTHRSVLVLLLCCAVVILLGGFEGDEPPPDRTITTVAIGLALGAIVLRRLSSSPVARPRTTVLFAVAALALAGGLGLLGVVAAHTIGAPETGILFVLAGAIFAVRPPLSAIPVRRPQ